jgi:hypothetical protein
LAESWDKEKEAPSCKPRYLRASRDSGAVIDKSGTSIPSAIIFAERDVAAERDRMTAKPARKRKMRELGIFMSQVL